MAKKSNSSKSTTRDPKNRTRQTTGKRSGVKRTASQTDREGGQGPTHPDEEPINQGIPEEHYYGERRSRTPGNPPERAGSLDRETCDRDAPYNRTYGRLESKQD
jgi:hypothetical protein